MKINLTKIASFKLNLKLPLPGIGCGVLGLSLAKVSVNLGKFASVLLRALEYRGYDSTGAAFQDAKKNIVLLKDVGAPSTLVKTLRIEEQAGKLFCGQVRWATFGRVTQKNAQPHEVKCKKHLYGAHNGNITNTRELKKFLLSEGHNVVSDNDGEMLVHTIEHYFDNELEKFDDKEQQKPDIRKKCMHRAIIVGSSRMIGSYAAVIIDPVIETTYAIKAGSSLYFGIGEIEGIKFGLASSDLTAVLKFTKMLVNLKEGEFIQYTDEKYEVYSFKQLKIRKPNQPEQIIEAGDMIQKEPVRSRLRAEDTELLPPHEYFMEQEIHAEIESSRKLIKLFKGGSNTGKRMIDLLQREQMYADMEKLCQNILKKDDIEHQINLFEKFEKSQKADTFYQKVKENYEAIYRELVKENFEKKYFFSSNKNVFIELLNSHFNKKKLLISKALDSIAEMDDVSDFNSSIEHFLEIIENTCRNSRNIYTIACGTSYHATMIASLFFNEIANLEVIPVLPGNFRGQYSKSLRDNDVIIGVSQSGETKDLIDIFNYVENSELKVKTIVLVNNMNSTLGLEKSDVSIPIYCGPEIAVPATKSFINQITLFYYLAIKVAQRNFTNQDLGENSPNYKEYQDLLKRFKSIEDIPQLIKETIETTRDQIEQVASKIYMEPSMHILATKITGVAKEGALKIRETVLNHAEGGEASEFKHGPNTILGKNTVLGLKNVKTMLRNYNNIVTELELAAQKRNISQEEIRKMSLSLVNFMFKKAFPFDLSKEASDFFRDFAGDQDFFTSMYRNYPLIYVTGPDDQDVNLTISQINTHKIRGGDSFIIAEENDKLLENARVNPHDEGYYGWGYIILPKTGDSLMTAFSATIALQLLAFRMSVRKMEKLDTLGIIDHGVHPDVPKNVSKSITVD
ncbi:MAG: SIS domain-containing protein [Candidatus Cloacimonetes bacterium]|nr:SIS domain-containing protein [Candidatus Cloacimonadota bacterium]